MCGTACAPSIRILAPAFLHLVITSLTSVIVPRTFETWLTATSFT